MTQKLEEVDIVMQKHEQGVVSALLPPSQIPSQDEEAEGNTREAL